KGDVGTVQLLVKADAFVQKKKKSGETALFYAARNGDINTVRLLVKFGAYVNEKNECGSTPLFSAASCDRTDVVRVLVELGASANEKNASGETALNVAGQDIRTLLDKAVNHSSLGVDFSEQHAGLKGQLTSAKLAEPNDNAASSPVEAMLAISTEDETLKVPLLDAGNYAMSSFLVVKLGRVLPNVPTTLQERCSFMFGWK
uniref:Uncharacterized protein n=1 Tax=Globisporangium ultimum (strain ATCC 200006 / CBS 805.95 / DAOM BR144) TaxID=431595 RepID=K3WBK4_GLOUD